MAQGKRKTWARVAATGFGVLLCTGLVGCMNNDKPKDMQKQVRPGLPGTPTLPANGAGAMNTRMGQPNQTFGGAGANLQPGGNVSPAAGLGAGQPRYGTSGANSLNTGGGVQPASYMNQPAMPGQPGSMSAPALQGIQPAGGPLGAGPTSSNHGSVAGAFSPPPPELRDLGSPVPPAAPGDSFAPVPPPASAAPQYSLGSSYR